jgi:hypothetical protein
MPGAVSIRSDRKTIEMRLKSELGEARQAYDLATDLYGQALRTPESGTTSVTFSFSYAIKAQHDAFERYCRALLAFNQFILYGELPKWPDPRFPHSSARESQG